MKTYQAKPAEVIRNWHLVDAKGKVLGQICTDIAVKLMGKNKVTFTSHVDSGDFVVVINAKEVVVTGQKAQKKMYYRHSGIPMGFKETTFEKQMARDAREIIMHAVKGMLPKNKMQKDRLARLRVFEGENHTYANHFANKA